MRKLRQIVHAICRKAARTKEQNKTVQADLPLYPDQASNFAMSVDGLMAYITAICAFFAVAITAAVIYFFFNYRRKHPGEVGLPIHVDIRLETLSIVVPRLLCFCIS